MIRVKFTEVTCFECGKTLLLPPHRIRGRKRFFCNEECITKYNNKRRIHCVCKGCGRSFTVQPAQKKWGGVYCSFACRRTKQPSYGILHHRIRSTKTKPKCCENCGKKTPYLDAANISGAYKEELSDWKYLCRGCHIHSDGRYKQLAQYGHENPPVERVCMMCGKKFMIPPAWIKKGGGKFCSRSCSSRHIHQTLNKDSFGRLMKKNS